MPNEPDDQELIDALRRRGRADLKKSLAAREAKFTNQQAPTAKVRRFPRWAIAATLLPLLGLAVWALLRSSTPEPQQLAMDYAFAYPNIVTQPIVRAEDVPPLSSLAGALMTYERGEYAAAADLLSRHPNTDTTTFYRGVIALQRQDWSAGCDLLKGLPNTGNFRIPARYYRALCALESGDVAGAKALLLPVADWQKYPGLQKRVAEMIDKIE